MHDRTAIIDTALEYLESGLSIIPIRLDGSKAPAIDSWKEYQTKRPTQREVDSWWEQAPYGIAVIGGGVSGVMGGGFEILDFDEAGLFQEFLKSAKHPLYDEILRLPRSLTPSGGNHIYYRCFMPVSGNTKLATQPDTDPETGDRYIKTRIETRGEGGYALVPPSSGRCHPSGKSYKMEVGSLSQLPIITPELRDALLEHARSFGLVVKREPKPKKERSENANKWPGVPPWEDFAAKVTWAEILKPHGWKHWKDGRNGNTYWTRPGKKQGISASSLEDGPFYVFSSNAAPFEPEVGYGKSWVYALLNHNGDGEASWKDLYKQDYGDRLGPPPPTDADIPPSMLGMSPTPPTDDDLAPVMDMGSIPPFDADIDLPPLEDPIALRQEDRAADAMEQEILDPSPIPDGPPPGHPAALPGPGKKRKADSPQNEEEKQLGLKTLAALEEEIKTAPKEQAKKLVGTWMADDAKFHGLVCCEKYNGAKLESFLMALPAYGVLKQDARRLGVRVREKTRETVKQAKSARHLRLVPDGDGDGDGDENKPSILNRPIILVDPGTLAEMDIACQKSILNGIKTGLIRPQDCLYSRGRPGVLVHVVRSLVDTIDIDPPEAGKPPKPIRTPRRARLSPVIVQANEHFIAKLAGQAAAWVRYNQEGEEELLDPPARVIKTVISDGEWLFPRITGITEMPTLRPDGSVLSTPGYDARTGLLYEPNCDYPPIPMNPTDEEVRRALRLLKEPFIDYRFDGAWGMSAAVSGTLTIVGRNAIDGPVPLYGISAPTPGSGKTLQADIWSIIATGRRAPRWVRGKDDDEDRKRLTTIALAGDPLVLIDNVHPKKPLGSEALDAALTSMSVQDRLLKTNDAPILPLRAMWIATGNNLKFGGDLSRRVIPINIDPGMAIPEEREGFLHPRLLSWVQEYRAELVVAALTVLIAYIVAGKPKQPQLKTIGSFEAWSDLVRNCLVWLGELDPALGRQDLREDSGDIINIIGDLLVAWKARYKTSPKLLSDVIEDAKGQITLPKDHKDDDPLTMREAIECLIGRFDIPNDKDKQTPATKLGNVLSAYKKRIIGGMRFVHDKKVTRGRLWKVEYINTMLDDTDANDAGSRHSRVAENEVCVVGDSRTNPTTHTPSPDVPGRVDPASSASASSSIEHDASCNAEIDMEGEL